MSMQLVGKENLPNVHIKEIELHRSSTKTILITNVHLYDFEQDGQMQWYNTHSLRKNMKIAVVASANPIFNDQITNGGGFLTPKDISRTQGYSKRQVKHKTFSIAAINKQAFDNEEDGLYTFPYRCKLELPVNSRNVSVFAVCYLDTEQYSLENSIDLLSLDTRTYHGAIVGENVLINGQVPAKATLLSRSDGSAHVGPVHQHQNRYMDGSKHSSTPHDKLFVSTIQSTKVKQYSLPLVARTRHKKNKKQNKTIVGELWHSIDHEKLSASFVIDMENFLIQNSEYAYLLRSVDSDLYSSLLDSIYFDRVTIYKQLVKTSKQTNSAGSRVDKTIPLSSLKTLIHTKQNKTSGILETQNKYVLNSKGRTKTVYSATKRRAIEGKPLSASISEITDTVSYKQNKRVIAFQDVFLGHRNMGNYQYSVDISFKDPAREYLENLLSSAKLRMSEFKNYRNRVLRRTNYNYYASSTRNEFSSSTPDSTWSNILQSFMELYNLMYELREENKKIVYNNLALFIHPKTATSNSIEWFYEKFLYLITKYTKYFNIHNNSFNRKLKLGYVNSTDKNQYSKVYNKFKTIVNFSEYDASFSFIPDEIFSNDSVSDAFPVLSYSDIRKMANMERHKYFQSDPAFSEKTMPMLTQKQINSLNNIRHSSFTYFSPASLRIRNKGKLDTTKVENIDLLKFNDYINNHSQNYRPLSNHNKQSKKIRQFASGERSSFTIKTIEREKENIQEYKDSSITLGKDSVFSKNAENNANVTQNKVSQDVKNRFLTYNISKEQDITLNKSYFVIDNEESIVSNILNSKKSRHVKNKMIRGIPLQIKSLIGSKYGFAKNNIFHSKQDLLSHPATKNLIETVFMTLVKIEFLDSYVPNTCTPRWTELTEYKMSLISRKKESVLCRLTPFDSPSLRISPDLFKTMAIQNKYFYISPSSETISNVPKNPLTPTFTEFGEEYLSPFTGANKLPLSYSKTIIINQPSSKDGPLSLVDYGSAGMPVGGAFFGSAGAPTTSNIGSGNNTGEIAETPSAPAPVSNITVGPSRGGGGGY